MRLRCREACLSIPEQELCELRESAVRAVEQGEAVAREGPSDAHEVASLHMAALAGPPSQQRAKSTSEHGSAELEQKARRAQPQQGELVDDLEAAHRSSMEHCPSRR